MKDSSSPKRSINLEDTIKIVERRQEWVRDYLMDVGAEPLEFVGSSNVDDDPVDVSDMIRETLGLGPLTGLRPTPSGKMYINTYGAK